MSVKQSKGGRDIVAYFAGHLANLVNGNDHLDPTTEIVTIKSFQLYERINRSLVGNKSYLDGLVGLWSYPPRTEADSAAEFYFDHVLDRPIARRGDAPSSSDTLRVLLVAHAADPFKVVDEPGLSTWKAVSKGPARLRRFQERAALFELSNRILRCLDAANRPYAEVLRLGLCPKDWLSGDEAAGVNLLKSSNAFLKALKTAMAWDLGRRPTAVELARAWEEAPVAGHPTVEAFAASPLGAAILTRIAGNDQTIMVSYDLIEGQLSEIAADDGDAALMEPEEALPILDSAVAAGAIAPFERGLLASILKGEPLAEAMRTDLGIRRRLKNEFDGDVEAYVADLSTRMARFAAEA